MFDITNLQITTSLKTHFVLLLLLVCAEFYHAIAHLLVLTGVRDINKMNYHERWMYFALDMTTVLLAYFLKEGPHSNIHTVLVIVHVGIHSFAILHLWGISKSQFFEAVFNMAELKYNKASRFFQLMYVFATVEDILTHTVNAVALLNTILN